MMALAPTEPSKKHGPVTTLHAKTLGPVHQNGLGTTEPSKKQPCGSEGPWAPEDLQNSMALCIRMALGTTEPSKKHCPGAYSGSGPVQTRMVKT